MRSTGRIKTRMRTVLYPDRVRKFYRADMAAYAGIHPKSVDKAGLPEPDGWDKERAIARPWWGQEKAEEFRAARRGRGWKTA